MEFAYSMSPVWYLQMDQLDDPIFPSTFVVKRASLISLSQRLSEVGLGPTYSYVLPIYAILCFPLRASSNRACCFAQVEEFRQKQALAMNGNERGINGDLVKKAGTA